MDITDLLPKKTAVPTPQTMPNRGVVSTPPAALTDLTMRVIVPGHSSDYDVECRWVRQGEALPVVGADCLVVWDETGAGTVVWWSASIIDMATQAELNVAVAVEAVTTVSSFSGTWVISSGALPATYYKDRGRTYLGGAVKSGTSGTSAFTLPPSYSPSAQVEFPVVASGGIAEVVIGSDGTVKPLNIGATSVTTVVYLVGIDFLHV